MNKPPPPPPPPPAPGHPPRTTSVSLSPPAIAIGSVLLIGVGFLIGWLVLGEEGGSRTGGVGAAGGQAAAPGWEVAEVQVPDVCGPTSSVAGRIAVRPEPEELRLSDYLPLESPIERFVAAGFRGPVDAVNLYPETLRQGLLGGFAQTFNDPNAPGGFNVYALRYPTQEAAVQNAANAFSEEICRGGATALEVVQEPGVFISYTVASGASSRARWVQGRDLIEVGYASYGDETEFLENLLLVTRATWDTQT